MDHISSSLAFWCRVEFEHRQEKNEVRYLFPVSSLPGRWGLSISLFQRPCFCEMGASIQVSPSGFP